jgi:TolB-like protein
VDAVRLVERDELGKILDEQQLKLIGLVDKKDAAKVGKLTGAQLMIMGRGFVMDKKLYIVTKIVGVETGLVSGTYRTVELSKPMSDAVMLLAEDLVKAIADDAAKLLPEEVQLADPLADIRTANRKKHEANQPVPTVAVVIPEEHRSERPAPAVLDPAGETEIKKLLIDAGFKVQDVGRNDLADWAKNVGKNKPWPAALDDVDVVVIGEGFSEFAARTGELVTSTGRLEINLIDRHSGQDGPAESRARTRAENRESFGGVRAPAGQRAAKVGTRKQILKHQTGQGMNARRLTLLSWAWVWVLASSCVIGEPTAATATDDASSEESSEAVGRSVSDDADRADKIERRLFVMPFKNHTQEEQYEPAAAGIGDLIGIMLAQQPKIEVVERQNLRALADEQARALKGLTGKEYAIRAGKLLKADTVLIGRLFLHDEKLVVGAQAIDIATERVLAAEQLACRPTYLMETALQFGRNLGKQMTLPLPEIDLDKIDKSPIASLHFAKGLSHFYSGNLDASIMQLMRTVDLDPDFNEAHYWAGLCYFRQNEDAHAIIQWEKYLEAQPDGRYDVKTKAMLELARQRDKNSPGERLGPDFLREEEPDSKDETTDKTTSPEDVDEGRGSEKAKSSKTESPQKTTGEDETSSREE